MKKAEKQHVTYKYELDSKSDFSRHIIELDEYIQRVEAEIDVTRLTEFINAVKESGETLCFYGAGGAMSPATFAADLAMNEGIVAMAHTPLNIVAMNESVISKIRFVAITGSGSPSDVVAATEHLVNVAPDRVLCITTASLEHKDRFGHLDNHVGLLMKEHAPGNIMCIDLSIHKDGYVGTRKHLCLALIMYKAFHPDASNLVEQLILPDVSPFELRLPNEMTLSDLSDLHILYGTTGRTAAVDMEGRILECGVMPAMATDLKNFTHGRHTYINTRPNSAILMLVAPQDEKFVKAITKLIPDDRPMIFVRTQRSDMLGALQLMICTFYLSIELGATKNINMHSPGTPKWGRSLWSLKLKDYYEV